MEHALYMDKLFPNQPPEKEDGNKEYKRCLKINNPNVKNKLNYLDKKATQMLYRLNEGDGKAVYLVGVDDDGFACGISKVELIQTYKYIEKITNIINAKIKNIRIYKSKTNKYIMSIRLFIDISFDF